MKRLVRKSICMLGCILFICLPLSVPVFAVEAYDVDSFANVTFVNNTERITLNQKSMDTMSRKMINLTTEEKVDAVLERFNINNLHGTSYYRELVNNFNEIGAVTGSIAYMKVDEVGNQTVMSERDCLAAIEAENTLRKTVTDSYADDEKISSNGYMKQTIMAIYYRNAPKGKYLIVCGSEWLKLPIIRIKDAMSVSSREMHWDTTSGTYGCIASYEETATTYTNGFVSNKTTKQIENELTQLEAPNTYKGFRCEWILPTNKSYVSAGNGVSYTYSKLATVMVSHARVINYDNNKQLLAVDYRYLHMQPNLNIKEIIFSWAQDSENKWLVVAKNSSLIQKNYDFCLSWDYNNHAPYGLQ